MVVDPPRGGLTADVREGIVRRSPRRVVYVGCDPASLARDVSQLARSGMELRSVDLFDLFPQTHHLEAVALLVRAAV